jgi:hypothetical protein
MESFSESEDFRDAISLSFEEIDAICWDISRRYFSCLSVLLSEGPPLAIATLITVLAVKLLLHPCLSIGSEALVAQIHSDPGQQKLKPPLLVLELLDSSTLVSLLPLKEPM